MRGTGVPSVAKSEFTAGKETGAAGKVSHN